MVLLRSQLGGGRGKVDVVGARGMTQSFLVSACARSRILNLGLPGFGGAKDLSLPWIAPAEPCILRDHGVILGPLQVEPPFLTARHTLVLTDAKTIWGRTGT